ncbi:hypothetical protein D3C76_1250160 [compost metagenome]
MPCEGVSEFDVIIIVSERWSIVASGGLFPVLSLQRLVNIRVGLDEAHERLELVSLAGVHGVDEILERRVTQRFPVEPHNLERAPACRLERDFTVDQLRGAIHPARLLGRLAIATRFRVDQVRVFRDQGIGTSEAILRLGAPVHDVSLEENDRMPVRKKAITAALDFGESFHGGNGNVE